MLDELKNNDINTTLLIGRNRLINEDFNKYITTKNSLDNVSSYTLCRQHNKIDPSMLSDMIHNIMVYTIQLLNQKCEQI